MLPVIVAGALQRNDFRKEWDALASNSLTSPLAKGARELVKADGDGAAPPLPELPPCDEHEWCADFSSSL